MAEATIEECIDIYIDKCHLEKQTFLFRPLVSVELYDIRTGVPVTSSGCSEPSMRSNGSNVTFWNSSIVMDYSFNGVSNPENTHFVFLFDISHDIQEPTRNFNFKRNDLIKTRLAWAFLKPIASNRELNLNTSLRLQLYKINGKCAASHQTCSIFHLYSEHKLKKFPGSLYVNIKGIVPKQLEPPLPQPTDDTSIGGNSMEISPPIKIAVSEWSRLPTQMCKLPNSRYAELSVTRRGCSAIAFSPCGKYIACGSFSKIVIGCVIERTELHRLSGHTGLIYELSWSPNGELLLSVSADCSAIIWNMNPVNKSPLCVLPHPSFVYCGKWLSDGRQLLTAGKDNKIRHWGETDSGFDLLEEFGDHDSFVSALEASGEDMAFSGDSIGILRSWKLHEGHWSLLQKFVIRESTGCVIDAIQMHPGMKRLVVTLRSKGSLMVDIATGTVLHIYSGENSSARHVPCLTPCGSLLFTIGTHNTMYVWEFETGRLLASYISIFINSYKEDLCCIVKYHPWEHMAAFGVMGANYPVALINFKRNVEEAQSLKVEYMHNEPEYKSTTSQIKDFALRSKPSLREDGSMEEKLAAIVRNIDLVLAAKREMTARVSTTSRKK